MRIYRRQRDTAPNHMVDKLHKLADGRFDELCFCVISTYQFP